MSTERFDIRHAPAPRESFRLLYISKSKFGGDWNSTAHTHSCTELFYCLSGEGQFYLSGQLYPVKPDDMIIVNPQVEHTELSLNASPLEYIVLGLSLIHICPCGLFYNAGFLKEKGWDVPKTWDEMWALGDKAAAEGTYLFTYPTTGYFDAFFYALMYAAGGPEFFNKATRYEEGIWDTAEAQTCFDIVTKLASYTNPITPAQANDQDFTQNQQLVLDNKALFMPNGTWIVGEMAEAPRADGFEWGMTALPAVKAGGDQYSYTWFEQAWIPAGAEHLDAAKQFVAYLYSDEACKLFAESGAIQPVLGIADDLDGDNKMFYSIYDNGAKAAMGNFAAFSAIPGVEVRTVFFDPVNSLVSGSMTEQQWIDGIKSASDQMRANIIE